MGVSTKSLISLISFALMILIINNVNAANAQYSDLPPPPEKPEKFTSKQQLKEYLVKLHEYYAIIGRPRFGRSFPFISQKQKLSDSNMLPSSHKAELNENFSSELTNEQIPINLIVDLLDHDHNGYTTKEEVFNFISLFIQKL